MKRIAAILILAAAVAVLAIPTRAQAAAHQAVLTWGVATDATPSTVYSVYRASGACPVSGLGTLTFVKLNAAGITALTYTDSGLAVGVYCYYVTQTQNASESLPGNTGGGPVKPNTITIQAIIIS